MDISEDAILGKNNLEIGDRVFTYRNALLDGKRLLAENGQLVDETEYPELFALTLEKFQFVSEQATTETIACGDKIALCISEGLGYYSQNDSYIYEYNFATKSKTLILNSVRDNVTSPFCDAAGENIVCASYNAGTNLVYFPESDDSGDTFDESKFINVGSNVSSVALVATDDLSTQFAVVAHSSAIDAVSICRRQAGAGTVRKIISNISNPAVGDRYVACTSDGADLFFCESIYARLYHYIDSSTAHADITAQLPASDGITSICVDSTDDSLYVLFNNKGLYRSTDKGVSWVSIPLPLITNYLSRVAVNGGVVAFFASGADYTANEAGVHISANYGDSWGYASPQSRIYASAVNAVGFEVEGSTAHIHFQELTDDNLTYIVAEKARYLESSDDVLSKIVADSEGA